MRIERQGSLPDLKQSGSLVKTSAAANKDSPYIRKGTFTIFAEKSKLDRELIRYQKYGSFEHPIKAKHFSQKDSFNQIMSKVGQRNSRNSPKELKNLNSVKARSKSK